MFKVEVRAPSSHLQQGGQFELSEPRFSSETGVVLTFFGSFFVSRQKRR